MLNNATRALILGGLIVVTSAPNPGQIGAAVVLTQMALLMVDAFVETAKRIRLAEADESATQAPTAPQTSNEER